MFKSSMPIFSIKTKCKQGKPVTVQVAPNDTTIVLKNAKMMFFFLKK